MFEKNFPADFISEAIDQTRGWFYTLMAISTLMFDRAPFKNCLVMGHVQDAEGRKMSKHMGNVVDPWEVLDKQGADAVRWYFYASAAPWLPNRFSGELVSEMQRKFMGTLWNTYAFFALYASIDDLRSRRVRRPSPRTAALMDQLGALQAATRWSSSSTRAWPSTRSPRPPAPSPTLWTNCPTGMCACAASASGARAWTGDKLAAFDTLYTVLTTLCGLCAPYIPFMAETMYQNLVVGNDPGRAGIRAPVRLPGVRRAAGSTRSWRSDMDEVIAGGAAGPRLPQRRQHQGAPARCARSTSRARAARGDIADADHGRAERQAGQIRRRRARLHHL